VDAERPGESRGGEDDLAGGTGCANGDGELDAAGRVMEVDEVGGADVAVNDENTAAAADDDDDDDDGDSDGVPSGS
jgi:hypothetical protein